MSRSIRNSHDSVRRSTAAHDKTRWRRDNCPSVIPHWLEPSKTCRSRLITEANNTRRNLIFPIIATIFVYNRFFDLSVVAIIFPIMFSSFSSRFLFLFTGSIQLDYPLLCYYFFFLVKDFSSHERIKSSPYMENRLEIKLEPILGI